MGPTIFATGTTGYIGGDALHLLLTSHPKWVCTTTCLVRDFSKGQKLKAAFPDIQVIYGTLGNAAVLEKEAANADIVLHFASSDHVGAAVAIKRGIERRVARGETARWIHTSGTDVFMLQEGEKGEKNEVDGEVKSFDDWERVKECVGRPDSAPHRSVDKVILDTATLPGVKTAIVCPSLVYGQGRGPGNQRSMQAYELTRLILERKKGFTIGDEDYMWFAIHIHDLSRFYAALIKAAITGNPSSKPIHTLEEVEKWNQKGYYIMESQEFRWNELAKAVTREAYERGLIGSDRAEVLDGEEKEKLKAIGVALWNVKSRAKGMRAREMFGWEAHKGSLMLEVPEIVAGEARRAGMME